MKRYYSSCVNETLLDKEVSICGWVHKRRDHGGVIFLDIRDITGIVQLVFEPDNKDFFKIADNLRSEYVIESKGIVKLRPKGQENLNLESGKIEIIGQELKIFNKSKTIPFQIDDHQKVNEDIRLKYRYIDLRRKEIQSKLILRSKVTAFIRDFLNSNNFLDIETPFLTKATPEGARDYLVPSRNYKGNVYALPQSPQLFKQLLMISGFDKYYQIVKCFRDEDLRADRQPEFTQIDIETSFLNENDIITLMEKMLLELFNKVLGVDLKAPFLRLPYEEAIKKYGSDKPDLRNPLFLIDVATFMKNEEFKVFSNPANNNLCRVVALNVPNGSKLLTRKMIDNYTKFVSIYGARGLAYIKVNDKEKGRLGLQSPIVKNLSNECLINILEETQAQNGDLIFFGADKKSIVNDALGALRNKVCKDLNLYTKKWAPLWVVDFPMFEKSGENFQALHHPFTSPKIESLEDFNNCENLLSRAYDIVLNGYEIGGGSIRIHNNEIQSKVFEVLGINNEEAQEKFGFLLDALEYGAPPHGGIAFGLDRIIMLMSETDNIRDVIAFPKTQTASCLLTGAPAGVDFNQLKDLGIRLSELPNR